MSGITTHILDTAKGCPAEGVTVSLSVQQGAEWRELARGQTNSDGRIPDFLPADFKLERAVYRMQFETESYLSESGGGFYPTVPVIFRIEKPDEHYHVPLLISPYGFSTYRGS